MEQTQARNDSYQKASSRFGYRRLLMNDIHCDMSRSRQNINQCISYIWEDLLLHQEFFSVKNPQGNPHRNLWKSE